MSPKTGFQLYIRFLVNDLKKSYKITDLCLATCTHTVHFFTKVKLYAPVFTTHVAQAKVLIPVVV